MKTSNAKTKEIPGQKTEAFSNGPEEFHHLMDDWLDTECEVSGRNRQRLLKEMTWGENFSDAIELRPSVSVRDRLISVISGGEVRECWIYYSRLGKLEKHFLRP